jgi:hypothetical protein
LDAGSERLENRLEVVEADAARNVAAVGEGVAGGEVEHLFVDLLQAPMGLEREQALIAGGAESEELAPPVDLADANRRADGDQFAGGGRGAAGA